MEKIKLKSKTLNIIPDGIKTNDGISRVITILKDQNTSLDEINGLFTDKEEIETMYLLSDTNEVLVTYNDFYTNCTEVKLEKNRCIDVTTCDVVTITLLKEDKSFEKIAALEDTVDTLNITVDQLIMLQLETQFDVQEEMGE